MGLPGAPMAPSTARTAREQDRIRHAGVDGMGVGNRGRHEDGRDPHRGAAAADAGPRRGHGDSADRREETKGGMDESEGSGLPAGKGAQPFADKG